MPTPANASLLLLTPGTRRVVGQSLLAILALAAITLVSARFQPDEPSLTSAALVYLVVVVVLSLNGSFTAAAVVSTIAVVFLQDLAALPLFSLSIDEPLDAVALSAFLTTALIITRLVSKMRGSLDRLRVSLEDHRQAENALSQARAELARVTRVTTLGELAASIAHEVNQPLTAIVADSNAALNWLAVEKPDLEVVRHTLSAIVKDSERAANVFTRIRGMLSRSAQPYQPCDISAIIRETLPMVRTEFSRHTIRMEVSLAAQLPLITGDAIQLQQVLLNLLINAAEASRDVAAERRLVAVSTEVQRSDSRTHVAVQVRDAGVGIPESDLPRLFEAFYTTKPGGLGMGLSVSKAIIERHGGRLWVTANIDHGATFHFSVPAQS